MGEDSKGLWEPTAERSKAGGMQILGPWGYNPQEWRAGSSSLTRRQVLHGLMAAWTKPKKHHVLHAHLATSTPVCTPAHAQPHTRPQGGDAAQADWLGVQRGAMSPQVPPSSPYLSILLRLCLLRSL